MKKNFSSDNLLEDKVLTSAQNALNETERKERIKFWFKIAAAFILVLIGISIGIVFWIKSKQTSTVSQPSNSTSKVVSMSGDGKAGFKDGPLATAEFNAPTGIVYDKSGNLWVADTGNNAIRVISNGVVTTIAGNGSIGGKDGFGKLTTFNSPRSIAALNATTMIIADAGNAVIRALYIPTSKVYHISLLFGQSKFLFSRDITQSSPTSVVAFNGLIYMTYTSSNVIGMINTTLGDFTMRIIAGSGSTGSLNGASTTASFNSPNGIAVDGSGNLFIADTMNNVVRRVSGSDYIVSTFAGNGTSGSTDGPSLSSTFIQPFAVLVDSKGTVYVTENSGALRKIASDGTVSTMIYGNSTLFSSTISRGLAISPSGDILCADPASHGIIQIVTPVSASAALVSAPTASKLTFTTQFGGTVSAGTVFTTAIVQVTDSTQAAVSGIQVSILVFTDSACTVPFYGGASFTGGMNVSDLSGHATFTRFATSRVGMFYFQASTISLKSACSTTGASVFAGSAASIYYAIQPGGPFVSGVPLLVQPVVVLSDGFGNPLAGAVVALTVFLDQTCTVSDPKSNVYTSSATNAGGSVGMQGFMVNHTSAVYILASSGSASVCSDQLNIGSILSVVGNVPVVGSAIGSVASGLLGAATSLGAGATSVISGILSSVPLLGAATSLPSIVIATGLPAATSMIASAIPTSALTTVASVVASIISIVPVPTTVASIVSTTTVASVVASVPSAVPATTTVASVVASATSAVSVLTTVATAISVVPATIAVTSLLVVSSSSTSVLSAPSTSTIVTTTAVAQVTSSVSRLVSSTPVTLSSVSSTVLLAVTSVLPLI